MKALGARIKKGAGVPSTKYMVANYHTYRYPNTTTPNPMHNNPSSPTNLPK